MKMKRIILTLTMLVALVATASAQAEIKFDKLIHNLVRSKSQTGTEGYLYLHQCRQQAFDYQPGYCQLLAAPYLLIPRSLSLQARRDRLVLPITARACSLVISRRASPSVLTAM